ncbi:MAG: histidine phosphatase family protein [Alphaproteobacteria bacterium]|nr:histidine phosphatase family protein [Alphaproteobacteria bacterium]
MTVRLILARHGNTFGPKDEPVWVGARSDLPLVEKGLTQAKALGEALRQAVIVPDSLIAGSLQRTRQTAEIVAETLGLPVAAIQIDPRLTEIDYGAWEGKSTAAIIASGDDAELAVWNKHSIVPEDRGWKPSEAQITADIASMLAEAEAEGGTTLIVTSNGILRFFASQAVNARAFPDRKVATGNICVMERGAEGNWHIVKWNEPPERVALHTS